MVSEALQRQEQMGALADELSSLPTGEEPTGTVYIPQTRKPVEGFEYFRREQSGLNLVANVASDHLEHLAKAVSRKVGKGYSAPTFQVLYDSVFLDPETIKDPVLKEVAKYCWAHAREGIHGRKVFSYPSKRLVDDEYRLSGKSVEVDVDENDAVGALELAKLFKEDAKRKVSRGRIWTNPASVRARWPSGGGACVARADAPGGRSDDGVALLMRTDEVQERNVVEVDVDDFERLQKEASDGKGWKERYEAAQRDFSALAKKHF